MRKGASLRESQYIRPNGARNCVSQHALGKSNAFGGLPHALIDFAGVL
jgi:hypothetical protein